MERKRMKICIVILFVALLLILMSVGVVSATVTVEELTSITDDPAREWGPAWSPDSNDIVFKRYTNPSKIIKFSLADSSELQLATHGWKYDYNLKILVPCLFGDPCFSPDGTKIVYGKDDCNGWVDIHVVNTDGTSDLCLTCSYSGENIRAIWSPLSNKIIYNNAQDCCNRYPWTTFIMNTDGTNKASLIESEYSNGLYAMSPDESKILFSASGHLNSLPSRLKIKDLDTNTIDVLDPCDSFTHQFFSRQTQSWQSQIFSPDALIIVYYSNENGNWDIYTINIDGTGKTQLTTDISDDKGGYFSPDGSKIVFVSDRNGNNDIWMMDANGDNQVPLTTNTYDDLLPSWSPDGNKIVFVSDRNGNYDIWVMELSFDDEGAITSNSIASPNPVPVGTSITLTALVSDETTGGSAISSAEFSIDGGLFSGMSAEDGTFDGVTEEVTTNIEPFMEAGVHNICVRGTDTAGNVGETECILLAVYDPTGGFVTGGGWINSLEGAYMSDSSLTGKANFGFVSKYKKGADVPIGHTEFQFKVADLNFHSDTYEWLVVAGPKAMYKGIGTINGEGSYGFMLSAIDQELTPSTDVDMFRIKMWDKEDGDAVVYDNQIDDADDADDADPATAIQGGNIVVHKK